MFWAEFSHDFCRIISFGVSDRHYITHVVESLGMTEKNINEQRMSGRSAGSLGRFMSQCWRHARLHAVILP